ncbi:hypothetical protein Bpfe_019600, partial [Biomphalaria pfeifferi]
RQRVQRTLSDETTIGRAPRTQLKGRDSQYPYRVSNPGSWCQRNPIASRNIRADFL